MGVGAAQVAADPGAKRPDHAQVVPARVERQELHQVRGPFAGELPAAVAARLALGGLAQAAHQLRVRLAELLQLGPVDRPGWAGRAQLARATASMDPLDDVDSDVGE